MSKKKISGKLVPNLVAFVVATLIWAPHVLPLCVNMASMQILFAIFLAPLAIIGLICSGFTGAAMIRATQDKIQSLLILVGMEVACVIGCIIHEVVLVGYPLELCFDVCQNVSLATAIMSYFIVVTILFIPAYCTTLAYRRIS